MASTRTVIAIDVDEVLLPLHEPFLLHHNRRYGTEFVYPDPEGRYYLNEFTGDNFKITMKKLRQYYKDNTDAHLVPLPGAVEAIKQLHERYDLVIVSSQQLFQTKYTKVALQQHFGDVFKEVHFTASNPLKRKQIHKSDVCLQLGAEYLVDDHVSNAINCAEAGIRVVLFGDYHWNREEAIPAGVVRCKDWREVLEYFDGKDSR